MFKNHAKFSIVHLNSIVIIQGFHLTAFISLIFYIINFFAQVKHVFEMI